MVRSHARAVQGDRRRRRPSMRKRYRVMLSEEERARLHTMIGRGIAPASVLTHARILLKANQGEAGPGWTDAAIGAALEVNPATVARVRSRYVAAGLDANQLKPWLTQRWCIPPEQDAEFVWRMEDVLAVSTRPYDPLRPQVCLDETSRQLLGEVTPSLPPAPGRPAREDYE